MTAYLPRPDSVADRAICYLRSNGKTSSAELAEACDVETGALISSLSTAIKYGAVTRDEFNGRLRFDLGDGSPPRDDFTESAADPVSAPAPAAQTVTEPPAAPIEKIDIPQFLPRSAVRQIAKRAPTAPSLGSRVTSSTAVQLSESRGTNAFRIAQWSDGTLEVWRVSDDRVLFSAEEAREIRRYFSVIGAPLT